MPSTSLDSGEFPKFAYVVLISTKLQAVLMCENDGEWDLPSFKYPISRQQDRLAPYLSKDFRTWLGVTDDQVFFTAEVEMLGYYLIDDGKRVDGEITLVNLYLFEAHGISSVEELGLPDNADWRDIHSRVIHNPEDPSIVEKVVVETVSDCVKVPSLYLQSLSDPRYRAGWFEKASKVLREAVLSSGAEGIDGRVMQSHMGVSSTLLTLDTSKGRYFLKSPTIGCNEVTITAKVAELFPTISPLVVDTFDELHCFITEGFEHKYLADQEYWRSAILTLGRLQLESRNKLEELRQSGCPIHDIQGLPAKMESWLNAKYKMKLEYRLDDLKQMMPVVIKMCEKLATFNIPLTLVHGDFTLSNTTCVSKEESYDVMLFDWEYAYIGHPFCDFHRVHERISSEVLDEYLALWSSFESLERAREAYELVVILGWMMKAWSVSEWSEECNGQKHPILTYLVVCYFNRVAFEVDGRDFGLAS